MKKKYYVVYLYKGYEDEVCFGRKYLEIEVSSESSVRDIITEFETIILSEHRDPKFFRSLVIINFLEV